MELQRRLDQIIELLIEVRDRMDPDPDLEPSLGHNPYGSDDREGDDCELHEGDGECDDEPSDNGIADAGGASEQWSGMNGCVE